MRRIASSDHGVGSLRRDSSHFREMLPRPATDYEPGEAIAGASVEVGGEEGLRLELACGIAGDKPMDRHRRHAAAIPAGGAAGDFDDAVGLAVPETDAVSLPGDLATRYYGGQLFQGLTFDRPPPPPLCFCGGKSNKSASRRKRVTTQTWLRTAARNSTAANVLSATRIHAIW